MAGCWCWWCWGCCRGWKWCVRFRAAMSPVWRVWQMEKSPPVMPWAVQRELVAKAWEMMCSVLKAPGNLVVV